MGILAIGNFAGGATKGYLATDAHLREQARADAEEARRQTDFNDSQTSLKAIRDAATEYGSNTADNKYVDPTDYHFSGGIDDDRPAAMATVSPEERMQNMQQRALALGARPEDAQRYALGNVQIASGQQGLKKGGLEISALQRNDRQAQNIQDAMDFHKGVMDYAQQNGGDLEDTFKTKLAPVANMIAPGLNTSVESGPQGKYIVARDAKGNVVPIPGPDGKTVNALPLNLGTIQHLTSAATDHMLQYASPDMWKTVRELGIKQQTADAATTEAGAKATTAKAAADRVGAENARDNAHAEYFRNHVNSVAAKAKLDEETRKLLEPIVTQFGELSPEDQAGAKGKSLLTNMAVTAARKTGDVTGLMSQLVKPDRSVVSAEREKAAYTALNNALGNPKAEAAARSAYPDVFGEDPLVTALKNAQKGNPPGGKPAAAPAATATTAAPAPKQALPTPPALGPRGAPAAAAGPSYSQVYGAIPEGTPQYQIPHLTWEEQQRIYGR